MHGRLLREKDGWANLFTDPLREEEDLCRYCQLEGICTPDLTLRKMEQNFGQRMMVTACRNFDKKKAA